MFDLFVSNTLLKVILSVLYIPKSSRRSSGEQQTPMQILWRTPNHYTDPEGYAKQHYRFFEVSKTTIHFLARNCNHHAYPGGNL